MGNRFSGSQLTIRQSNASYFLRYMTDYNIFLKSDRYSSEIDGGILCTEDDLIMIWSVQFDKVGRRSRGQKGKFLLEG